jgi:hypothetical protein
MSTLQAWAAPTDVTKYADHTFVYCPDNGKYFGCWNGGRTNLPNAVQIVSASAPNAYAIANCYRDPVLGRPDTAGIGIYAANGVCHQSANCFLYPTGVKMSFTNGRPAGLLASTAAYGFYGTDIAGSLPAMGTHFAHWYAINYYWCSGKKDLLMATAGNPELREVLEAVTSTDAAQPGGTHRSRVRQLALHVGQTAPEIDLERLADLHHDYLQEHDAAVSEATYLPEVKAIDMKTAERLNDVSRQFQNDLALQIGTEAYIQLMGRDPTEAIPLVDLSIVEALQREPAHR